MTTTIIQVPLDKLLPGEKAKGGSIDSRKTDEPIDGLISSILAHGLLVPLLVHKGEDGKIYTADGNRRLRALQQIHKKGHAPAHVPFDVPCIEPANGNALELSMVANVERAELHPVDRFEVYAALVEGGETVDNIAKRYALTVKQVRQALALGRMATAVRDAWRAGTISAEMAEAFTITKDHGAQAAALKKIGKNGSAWSVKQLLAGGSDTDIAALLKAVGRDAYEKAGHQINVSLFHRGGEDDEGPDTVSDIAALRQMAADKIEHECAKLVEAGWKWATPETGMPKDWRAWRVVRPETGKFTKDQMAAMGCVVDLDYAGVVRSTRGIVKPGDKGVSTPKSPKVKKAEAKQREERKAETGGLSNLLAMRLSKQLTAAVREAMAQEIDTTDAIALTIAALACANTAMPHMRLAGMGDDDARHNNDFGKYLKLGASKPLVERGELLMRWLATAIDLTCHDGGSLTAMLHPGKGERRDVRLIAELIDEKALLDAARKHFDAKDYFACVSKALIVEAVQEALGKEHAERVAKMKTGEAAKYAVAHVPKTGWVPEQFRL